MLPNEDSGSRAVLGGARLHRPYHYLGLGALKPTDQTKSGFSLEPNRRHNLMKPTLFVGMAPQAFGHQGPAA